jgi:hypothetical protein
LVQDELLAAGDLPPTLDEFLYKGAYPMIAMGILDPTKVTRTALQNAASVSGLIITTEAMVAELPKKDGGAPMPDMGGMGGMGGMM